MFGEWRDLRGSPVHFDWWSDKNLQWMWALAPDNQSAATQRWRAVRKAFKRVLDQSREDCWAENQRWAPLWGTTQRCERMGNAIRPWQAAGMAGPPRRDRQLRRRIRWHM